VTDKIPYEACHYLFSELALNGPKDTMVILLLSTNYSTDISFCIQGMFQMNLKKENKHIFSGTEIGYHFCQIKK